MAKIKDSEISKDFEIQRAEYYPIRDQWFFRAVDKKHRKIYEVFKGAALLKKDSKKNDVDKAVYKWLKTQERKIRN